MSSVSTLNYSGGYYSGGCEKLNYSKVPAFNFHKSKFSLAVTQSAKVCAKTYKTLGGVSYVYQDTIGIVRIPIHFGNLPRPGAGNPPYNVTLNWTVSLKAFESIAMSSACPPVVISRTNPVSYEDCGVGTDVYGYALILLTDLTARTSFVPAGGGGRLTFLYNYSSYYNDTYCQNYGASCTNSFGATASTNGGVNGGLAYSTLISTGTWAGAKRTDSWALTFYVNISSDVVAYSDPHSGFLAKAVALIDLAGVGKGVSLDSILVT